MTRNHHARIARGAVALFSVVVLGPVSVHAAALIPSPATDLLLASNGGIADVNGSSTDGPTTYSGLPPANLNDGDRDGVYNNGAGVDGVGSISHTANSGANQEMGVKIPSATFIGSVNIFNRTDGCCGGRIDASGTVKFTLNIFNGSDPTPAFTQDYSFSESIALTAANGDHASGMTIPTNVTGDYVQVIQHNNDYMNLAEIEAFVPEPASLTLLGLGAIGALTRRRSL